jgi:hypothetical protein
VSSPGVTYRDALALLRQLGDATQHAVLIGGQAVNFWAQRYRSRVPELQTGPFVSKDIDFHGVRQVAMLCAERLGGRLRSPSMDDAAAATASALVEYRDETGATRVLDFLTVVHGLDTKRVRDTAVPVDVLDAESGKPTGVSFLVLHPVLSMFSRVHNTVTWTKYRTEHALQQLAASVLCAREFLRDLSIDGDFDEPERIRAVLDHYEDVFDLCTSSRGRQVHHSG